MPSAALRLCLCVQGAAAAFRLAHGSTFAPRHGARATVALAAWEECAGCQLLRPLSEPRGIVHFLGGVFVSPQPQVAYRYLLESLSQRGYVVIATPYAVSFDYNSKTAERRTENKTRGDNKDRKRTAQHKGPQHGGR